MGGYKSDSGKRVRDRWKIPAQQVRFHHEGNFFMPLEVFPGALADKHGYVLFQTEADYMSSPHLDHRGSNKNPRIGVPGGISKMPGYIKVTG